MYVPSVTSAISVSCASSSAVATLNPSISTTAPSGVPIPIAWMRTPAEDATSASCRGSGSEVFSPSESRTIAEEPKNPMSTSPASLSTADGSICRGFPAIVLSEVKMPCPREVAPLGERRRIAATTSSFTDVGRSTVRALSPNATMPIRMVLGCRSAKAVAAAFAAAIRVGSRSSARMLFDTSKARITVPSRCGSAKLMVGRASPTQTRTSATANSANGTCRRHRRPRRDAEVGTSPSAARRSARRDRRRTSLTYASTRTGTSARQSSIQGESSDISRDAASATRRCGRRR